MHSTSAGGPEATLGAGSAWVGALVRSVGVATRSVAVVDAVLDVAPPRSELPLPLALERSAHAAALTAASVKNARTKDFE